MDTQQNQNTVNNQPSGFLKQMEEFFNTYLHKKAPFHLPPSVKEWIVKFGPWITLVLMVFALPLVLAAVGLTAFFTPFIPFAMMYGGTAFFGMYWLFGLIALLGLILQAAALPGLFGRRLAGWRLLYYSVLVGAVGQLLLGHIINLIFNVVISMYLLFEIKEYYK